MCAEKDGSFEEYENSCYYKEAITYGESCDQEEQGWEEEEEEEEMNCFVLASGKGSGKSDGNQAAGWTDNSDSPRTP